MTLSPKRVITSDEPNIIEFNALNADLRSEKGLMEAARIAIGQSQIAADTAVANIISTTIPNLAYDVFNRIVAVNGLAAEFAAGHINNAAALTVLAVGAAGNSYAWPILQTTSNGGRMYLLSESEWQPGDTITLAAFIEHTVPSPGPYFAIYARNSSGTVIGQAQSPRTLLATDTLKATLLIPAGTTKLEARVEGNTATVKYIRWGLWKGTQAYSITEDRAGKAEFVAAQKQLAANATQLADVAAKTVEAQQILISSNQTDVLPTIPGVPTTVPSASVQAAWGVVLAPGGSVTFNLLTIKPYGTLTVSKARIEVRDTATNAVTAYADISASTYNAASAAGNTVQTLLNTPVTTSANITIMLYAPGQNLPGYYLTPISSIMTMRAFRGSGTDPSGVPTTNNSSGGLWVRLHNDSAAALKTYAAAPPGQSADPATLRQAAWDALLGPADVLLPDRLYVLKDAITPQFNLYLYNVITGRWAEAGNIDSASTHGALFEEFWRVEPLVSAVPLGTSNLTLTLRDQLWTLAKTLTVSLVVGDKTAAGAVGLMHLGDSNVFRAQVMKHLLTLLGLAMVGNRVGPYYNDAYMEGQGGWAWTDWFSAGRADGLDSWLMFPTDLSGAVYRGNTERLRKMIAADTTNDYDHRGYSRITKGNGSSYVYNTATGYPLSPQVGWVVFDPTKAAGSQWQKWDGSAWVADSTQARTFALSLVKYYQRFPWLPALTHLVLSSMTNDFSPYWTDADVSAKWTGTVKGQFDTLIAAARAHNPTVKICIELPPMTAGQDARAVTNSGTTTRRHRRNMQLVTRYILDAYSSQANRDAGLYVVNASGGIDPVYGFSTGTGPDVGVTQAANSRSSTLIQRDVDWGHPSESGARQRGDWLAGWIQATR